MEDINIKDLEVRKEIACNTPTVRNQGNGYSITIKIIPKPAHGMVKVGLKLR